MLDAARFWLDKLFSARARARTRIVPNLEMPLH